jgi:type III restriction enzyme
VRNVTTIVGLRAYAAASNILPEQTLGRGLRRMYGVGGAAPGDAAGTDVPETVSVMGTPAFMEFVESIQSEGVELERVPMGGGARREDSLVVEVETANPAKNVDALDIALPRLSRRYQREYRNLDALDALAMTAQRLPLKPFTPEETREIVFKTMLDGEQHHSVQLDGAGIGDGRSVIAFFARQLLKELRLVGGYDVLYGQVKAFVRERLFEGPAVDIDDPQVLRNLSEAAASKRVFDTFKAAINALTVQDSGSSRIEDFIRLRDVRPFRTQHRDWLPAKRSLFNRIVGEPGAGGFELRFARFLDEAPGVAAFAKNYLAVGFKLDYVKTDGDLSTYTPDFLVKADDGSITIVETKGREELDLPRKMARLAQWCEDATAASQAQGGPRYGFIYVDQESFERHPPQSFAGLVTGFREYQKTPVSLDASR